VHPGDVLRLRARTAAAGGAAGLPLRFSYADRYMAEVVGLGKGSDFYLDVAPYTYALPLFPLPYKNRTYVPPATSVETSGRAGDVYAIIARDRAGNVSRAVLVRARRAARPPALMVAEKR
jgi:hypothetical protein